MNLFGSKLACLLALGCTLCSLLGFGCSEPISARPVVTTEVDDWRDEVIYQVVVDRFENGDPSNDFLDGIGPEPSDLVRHQGGDWRGLRQRLDYIRALGGTTVWISPIVANVDRTPREDGYHGYWAADFTELNPRFGDLDELRALVRDAHNRGMKIIVDVVTNHSGRVFNYDLNANGRVDEGEIEPAYRADGYDAPILWTHRPRLFNSNDIDTPLELASRLDLGEIHFRRRGRSTGATRDEFERGDFPTGLRDLDTERDDVIDALVATYSRWVLETNIDGVRIDAVPHVEEAFWPRFASALRTRLASAGKRRFLLLGEVFSGDPATLARYSGETGALDAAFDFTLKFDAVDGVILEGRATSTIERALDSASLYRPFEHPGGIGLNPWQARVAIADNHDTWRLRGELDSFEAARLALVLVTTIDAIPCIYYGTEQEFRGQGGGESRERMWDSGFRTDTPTYRWLQQLLRLRAQHEELRRGALRVRYTTEEDGFSEAEDAGMLAYERALDGRRMLIVMNAHALKSSRAAVPSGFAVGTRLVDALGAPTTATVSEGGEVELALGPREVVFLRQEADGGS